MILMDLQQVLLSAVFAHFNNQIDSTQIDERLIRHIVLNIIRANNSKYRGEYGELVIAADTRSWRKNVYPHYKANRKKDQEKSDVDWSKIFECINRIREEIKTFFPYRVIEVEGAEADDVIATLVMEFGRELNGGDAEKLLILSTDHDFVQLQVYANVQQWDPIRKRWLKENNPEAYLKEHILRGDAGDGVPNFLSDDDCFVAGKRQKPVATKKLKEWLKQDPEVFCTGEMLRGFRRNEQLIDLHKVPADIQKSILTMYHEQVGKKRDKLMDYFISNRLKTLMETINDF